MLYRYRLHGRDDLDRLKDPGISGASKPGAVLAEGDAPAMARPRKYPDELRERAVRLVFESKRPTWCLSSDFTLDVVQSEVGRVIATQLCWVVRPRVSRSRTSPPFSREPRGKGHHA